MTINEVYQRHLLGRFISSAEEYYVISDKVAEDMFEGELYIVFQTYLSLLKKEKHPSLQRMMSVMANQKDLIYSIVSGVDFSIPVSDLLEELEEGRRQRILTDLQRHLLEKKDSDQQVISITRAVESIAMTKGSHYDSIGTVLDEVLADIKQVHSGIIPGIKTGFSYFDGMTGGLQDTDLVIIAAEPSQGKTSLALNIAEYSNVPCAIISLEMGKKQLAERLAMSIAETPKYAIKSPNPDPNELQKFYDAVDKIRRRNIIIADIKNSDIVNICGLIRAAVMRYGVKFVVVDYLQLIHSKRAGSREQEVGQIARTLKNLAKELNIPILVLSQLNRSQESFPTMRRLRDSGQIEEAADVIWFIYRPEEYRIKEWEGESTDGLAIHIIAKGRNYGTGLFKTKFRRRITKFVESDYSDNDGWASGGKVGAGELDF